MGVSRREVLAGLGGAGLVGGAATLEQRHQAAERGRLAAAPLPFYGGYASAIRPDLGRPSVPSGTVIWRAETREKVLALTFDDGPHPDWTPKVLAALAAERVPATFFLKGVNVRDHAAIHHDSVAAGHELANHTWSHPDLARLDFHACADQIRRCTDAIYTAYGLVPTLFRPPYGHLGGAALLAATQAQLTIVLWSAQFREDRFVDRPVGVVDDLATQAHAGAIVLGHDTGNRQRLVAIDHIREVVARLRDDGYRFATVSRLLQTVLDS